jgi:hypothetical protein
MLRLKGQEGVLKISAFSYRLLPAATGKHRTEGLPRGKCSECYGFTTNSCIYCLACILLTCLTLKISQSKIPVAHRFLSSSSNAHPNRQRTISQMLIVYFKSFISLYWLPSLHTSLFLSQTCRSMRFFPPYTTVLDSTPSDGLLDYCIILVSP